MHIQSTVSKYLLGAVLAIAVAAVASPAGAAWDHEINANECESLVPLPSPLATLLYRGNFGMQNNDATTNKYVTCPLRRMDTSNTNGMEVLAALWTDPAGRGSVCNLASNDSFGNVVWSQDVPSFSGSPNGDDVLSNIPTSSSLGHYSLMCTIPPNGQLNSIEWRER